MHILGTGNRFEDICRETLMSDAVVRCTFHTFCKRFASELYDDHIRLPAGRALEKTMAEYDRLGLTGAIGSTDFIRIKWKCCPLHLQNSYTGDEDFPTIAYQATVDHSGRVLAVTKGFAGSQNAKTIMRYDPAVQRVREDPRYTNQKFQLARDDGTLIECKGNYLVVGNGHIKVRWLREYLYLEYQ